MLRISPTFYPVEDHSGNIVEITAIPASKRQDYLDTKELLYEEIRSSDLSATFWAKSSLDGLKFALDSEQMADFRYLLKRMLSFYGLDMEKLDCRQIHDLVFSCVTEDSTEPIIDRLEFIPHDPNGEVFETDVPPVIHAIAVIAAETGDYFQAKQLVDEMPMNHIHQLLKVRAEMLKAAQKESKTAQEGGKGKPRGEQKEKGGQSPGDWLTEERQKEIDADRQSILRKADPALREHDEALKAHKKLHEEIQSGRVQINASS